MNQYRKINDIVDENYLDFFVDKSASINIEVEDSKVNKVNYKGNFADVIGLSIDMINGLAWQYEIDGKLSFNDFYHLIKNHDSIINHFYIDKDSIKASISLFISEDRNIDAIYSGSLLGYSIALNSFIEKFCKDYNIDPMEYEEFAKFGYDQFKKNKCADKMNITKF